MLPDRVSNPGPPTYESGALPIALRGPAVRRGRGGARPPIIWEGGNIPFGPPIIWEGGNIPFAPPPNNPPAFSFNFYVKQEKITNVPS